MRRHRQRQRDVTAAVTVTDLENQRFREQSSEEPDGSSAPAALGDPVKSIFDEGVALLARTGMPARRARSLVGQWRSKARDDGRVAALIREAQARNVSEPIAWFAKALAALQLENDPWADRHLSDIVELERLPAAQAQAVAEHLLPAGKREGREWRAGSIAGEPGHSLGVHLGGPKAGAWRDVSTDGATGQGGDLIDPWSPSGARPSLRRSARSRRGSASRGHAPPAAAISRRRRFAAYRIGEGERGNSACAASSRARARCSSSTATGWRPPLVSDPGSRSAKNQLS